VSVALEPDGVIAPITDGEIAIINLQSARSRCWSKFFADPTGDGVVETVVEHEQLALQFFGDASALDRVRLLADRLDQAGPASARVRLIQAQVASMAHRFADARHYLSQARTLGAPAADIDRLRLTIDQACGTDLDKVLDARRRLTVETQGLEDFVALGSLLADLCDFAAADQAYKQALRTYRDVSPFPVARVCFQLGMLWGELAPEPDLSVAVRWYQRAIKILPMYTKARVHLAEIFFSEGRLNEAESLLEPLAAIGDPEVAWRLADVQAAKGRFEESEASMKTAHAGFESLLERHMLAFADHGAEFYAASGNDNRRALQLARINVANRPTLRAFKQAHEIAMAAGEPATASELRSAATKRWGHAAASRLSSQLEDRSQDQEGAAA
jgi:tetratricopeptide (TPR) repeat protein